MNFHRCKYMKNLKLILLLVFLPTTLYTNAQTVFYNKGALSIVSSDTTNVTLYVKGDAMFGSDTIQNTTSDIVMKTSRFVITGNLKNNVTSGTVFNPSYASNGGWVELKSNVTQNITTDTTSNFALAYKRDSYIDFPNLKINNSNHVKVDPRMGVQVNNLQLNKGWLVLDSRRVNDDDFAEAITNDLRTNRSVLAHLLVNGSVDYRNWSSSDPNERGFVEVNVALDEYQDKAFGDNASVVAFGTPFKNLKADYFMWNHLFMPTASSFIGPNNKFNGDPTTDLKPGVGYAVGIDVRGSQESFYLVDVDPMWSGIDFSQRAKDHFYFNRFRFGIDNSRSANNLYKTHSLTDSAYQYEKLNDGDVQVNLVAGFNYLANPFTAPLNLEDLLGENIATDWAVISDGQNNTNRDIVNRVWILKGDAVAYSPNPSFIRYAEVVYNYYLAKSVGGTYTNEYGDSADGLTIAPLQMFVIYAAKPTTITIPRSKQSMSAVKFLRSTPKKNKRTDDFIIEVIDDNTSRTDRASIVLRSAEELNNNKEYYSNVSRLNTSSAGGDNAQTKSTAVEGLVKPNLFSQIYTVDETTNKALTVKFLASDTTTSTPLYLTPATTSQNITLRGLRLDSKDKVKTIYLEDKLENKKVELTHLTLYQTTSHPTDAVDRFVLHFSTKDASGIEDGIVNEDSFFANYANGVLTVSEFDEKDFGRDIYLYNTQGKLVLTSKIDNTKMELPCYLAPGAYIVKTTTAKANLKKLLVK